MVVNVTKEAGLEPEEGRDEAFGKFEKKSYGGRCSGCGSMYAGASMAFLYSDETGCYCRCGGRLREEVVEPEAKRHYRLVVPEELRATRARLRRRMERPSGDGVYMEVAEGGRGERLVTLVVVE